jgi:nitrate/nitrite transporter NarK
MAQDTSAGPPPGPARHHWSIPHIAAIALAIAVYFAIYSVTGDSDLFIALATGAAGGYLTWVAIEIEFWFRKRRQDQPRPG